jgi:glycosyltransferase involved in cell wall biosynthesis
VIIGLPRWQLIGPTVFAERMVRGLTTEGHDARILLTETDCNLVQAPSPEHPVPEDLPCDKLPAGADDTWCQRWEALERYLEERAPCYYLMLHDWRNNVIAPRLSRRVRLIGLVQADSELEIGQAARLGTYWDAIVAVSDPIHFKLMDKLSLLAPRMVTISPGVGDHDAPPSKEPASNFIDLFERVEALHRRGGFVRARHSLAELPESGGGMPAIMETTDDSRQLPDIVRWPDPPLQRTPRYNRNHYNPSVSLEDHKILVTAKTEFISGVDIFAVHLVRGLCARGLDARILGIRPPDQSKSLTCIDDLNFEERHPNLDADYLGWPNRWRLMTSHLSSLGPSIYIPNYDHEFSCIAPQLPSHVRVVGIGHSDDPWHYEHLCRIGHACDALVGVSSAITEHLRKLCPPFASRLATIPYGIAPKDPELVARTRADRTADEPLRIVYAGRLVQRQKRALDVVAIARILSARGIPFEMVVMGDGDLRSTMERSGQDLILSRKLWFTGAQPNASVLEFLKDCDIFLMPSAFEGLSVAMLEAMSRGLVPVVSDIRSGVPDVIVPGENGLVVPVGEISAFADRLEWLWKNPADLHRLGAAAAATVKTNFTVDQMVDRYVELFRQMVAAPSTRFRGPIAPPHHLTINWSTWAARIAADPMASVRRVTQRFCGKTPWTKQ